jgi:16S rRNA (cytosine1402-N4)-methyltransferase
LGSASATVTQNFGPHLDASVSVWHDLGPAGPVRDITLTSAMKYSQRRLQGTARRSIVERIQPSGRPIGIEVHALKKERERLSRWKEKMSLVQDILRNLLERFGGGVECASSILFDLGMSSAHLGTPSRGFSFCQNGALLMRFDRHHSLAAAETVNFSPEKEIVNIMYDLGKERSARGMASAIVRRRERCEFFSTTELAGFIAEVVGSRPGAIHQATKTFQVLRMAVKRQTVSPQRPLPRAVMALKRRGRLAVVSYHSLEDRVVKQAFRQFEKGCACPPDFSVCRCGRVSGVEILTEKPICPSASGARDDPRSRSAGTLSEKYFWGSTFPQSRTNQALSMGRSGENGAVSKGSCPQYPVGAHYSDTLPGAILMDGGAVALTVAQQRREEIPPFVRDDEYVQQLWKRITRRRG